MKENCYVVEWNKQVERYGHPANNNYIACVLWGLNANVVERLKTVGFQHSDEDAVIEAIWDHLSQVAPSCPNNDIEAEAMLEAFKVIFCERERTCVNALTI